MNIEHFIWSEAYRPHTIADCIIPSDLKELFQGYIAKGEIQHLLLTGVSGVGKTTVAKALCEELDADHIIINGSEESGIDVLRTKIMSFVSTVSMNGKTKIVILDEGDHLSAAFQPALRGVMQDFASSCRFIITCNYKNRVIQPLHSRMTVIDFKIPKAERPRLMADFAKRIRVILKDNGVEYDDKVLFQIVANHFPDFRKTLDELQRHSVSGKIDERILAVAQDVNIKVLSDALRNKDFVKMRTWVVNNIDNDPQTLFRKIYEMVGEQVNELPQFILILAEYQSKAAWAVDQEINLVACCVELMASVTFKD